MGPQGRRRLSYGRARTPGTKYPNYDSACFHAQQCAEKYLKAFLQQQRIAFRFTHNLTELLTVIIGSHSEFVLLRDPLLRLNQYSVAPRYPLYAANKAEATAAIKDMREVRRFVRARLGLSVS